MEFLNPKQQRRRTLQLYLGYALVGIAILFATTILLYQAYGFGLDRNGQVIQSGLLYLSSQPGGADIYLNNERKDATNARFNLPAGSYEVSLRRDGYRNWNRQVTIDGGSVSRFDYPFLFPTNLSQTTTATYQTANLFTTQSPSRRWLIVAQPNQAATGISFAQYDLQNRDQAATSFTLPTSVATLRGEDGWQVIEWANDNRRVLIKHTFTGGFEYIMVDRQAPDQSFNVSTRLNTTVADIRLLDKRYDTFTVYDPATQVVTKASVENPTPVNLARGVVAYQTYGDDTVLYVTSSGAETGKVKVVLNQNNKSYTIRTLTAGSQYLLDLTAYDGDFIVAAGSAADNRVYVYKNPASTSDSAPKQVLVPVGVLKVDAANYLAFSSNTQYVLAESGNRFSVYDIRNDKTYNFTVTAPLDATVPSARWMDGNRLVYASGGKLHVIDYDNNNAQSLMSLDAGTLPYFDTGYEYVYTYATVNNELRLQSTALRTAADL